MKKLLTLMAVLLVLVVVATVKVSAQIPSPNPIVFKDVSYTSSSGDWYADYTVSRKYSSSCVWETARRQWKPPSSPVGSCWITNSMKMDPVYGGVVKVGSYNWAVNKDPIGSVCIVTETTDGTITLTDWRTNSTVTSIMPIFVERCSFTETNEWPGLTVQRTALMTTHIVLGGSDVHEYEVEITLTGFEVLDRNTRCDSVAAFSGGGAGWDPASTRMLDLTKVKILGIPCNAAGKVKVWLHGGAETNITPGVINGIPWYMYDFTGAVWTGNWREK